MNTGEKSHVGIGVSVCPICYAEHDTVVLLDKRLRKTLEHKNLMGFELCAACKAQEAEYIAIVIIDNPGSAPRNLTPRTASTTGTVIRVRRSVWPELFNEPCPGTPLVYADEASAQKLEAISKGSEP